MIFYTSILSNYLPRALLLAESVLSHHPSSFFRIYIYDFSSIPPDSLSALSSCIPNSCSARLDFCDSTKVLPNPCSFNARYDVVESCTAVKPFIARFILEEVSTVVYLDPDIYVYQPMFDDEASFLPNNWDMHLTPHVLRPYPTSLLSERLFLSHGIFNLGYFAARNSPSVLLFLDWWCETVDFYGVNFPASGLFVDQKPLDFAPVFIERLNISRHPGWNVAWWNLFCDDRRIESDRRIIFNGLEWPLVFFHFSNLDSTDKSSPLVSKPLSLLRGSDPRRLELASYEELNELYQSYFKLLERSTSAVEHVISSSLMHVLPRGIIAKIGRIINSELYRLVHIIYDQDSATSIYRILASSHLCVRIYKFVELLLRSGINLRQHFRILLSIVIQGLLSPTLFDFTRIEKRSRVSRRNRDKKLVESNISTC